jgi:uncharacterized membrane protein
MRVSVVLMALFYVFAGAMHFVKPEYYVAMMPPFLPAHLFLVYVSGAAELAGGLGVLHPRTRKIAAYGIVALLVAVFPANIYIAVENVPMFGASEGPGIFAWLRLPIQFLLIYWAVKVARVK